MYDQLAASFSSPSLIRRSLAFALRDAVPVESQPSKMVMIDRVTGAGAFNAVIPEAGAIKRTIIGVREALHRIH